MKALITIALFWVMLGVFGLQGAAADLIEPSRTLNDGTPAMGRLTVLSEPPGLDIVLDGATIGSTPLFSHRIPSGTYALRVADAETTVVVEPDKTLRVSLFKEQFITVPVADPKPTDRPAPTEGRAVRRPPASKPAAPQQSRDLTSWDRFLNGTSPVF